MQRKISNERGLSLIEILAALVLISIFSIIIWNFFFKATEINSREVVQSSLQQEANFIVNTVHQTHTKEKIIKIDTNSEKTKLIVEINDKDPIIFSKSGILYEVLEFKCISKNKDNQFNSFSLKIKLISSKFENISFSTQSRFSKLENNSRGSCNENS